MKTDFDKFTPGRSFRIERYDRNKKHLFDFKDWNAVILVNVVAIALLIILIAFTKEIDRLTGTIVFHSFLVWGVIAFTLGFIILRFRKFVKK